MLNLNKGTKTKLKPILIFKNCLYVCMHHRTQHRTVLIIFPLILQTFIIAQMMSTGGKGQLSND